MNCDSTDKVSLLVDGELAPAEAEKMRTHLTACRICRLVEQDFLRLRHQIGLYEFETDPVARRQTLWKVLASERVPLWRRKIALPAPVFALVVVAWLALGVWLVLAGTMSSTPAGGGRVGPVPASANNDTGEVDLSRFDRGERAMIYKERRSDTAVGDKGASQ